MAGWRGTCRALNWVCMLYRWLAGSLVMIAVSRWPWWQLHAGRPRPACLFLSGPGTLSRQLLSPTLITPSCPARCLATPSQPLHNTSLAPQCNPQWQRTTSSLSSYRKDEFAITVNCLFLQQQLISNGTVSALDYISCERILVSHCLTKTVLFITLYVFCPYYNSWCSAKNFEFVITNLEFLSHKGTPLTHICVEI